MSAYSVSSWFSTLHVIPEKGKSGDDDVYAVVMVGLATGWGGGGKCNAHLKLKIKHNCPIPAKPLAVIKSVHLSSNRI